MTNTTKTEAETIAELALIGSKPDHDARICLAPKGFDLHDLERYWDAPSRHHGEFSTNKINDFANYLINASEQEIPIEVYISADTPHARAIINPGHLAAPSWHDWIASLNLQASPAFAALIALTERPSVLPDQLIDFIDDWGNHCEFSVNGEAITAPTARARFGDVTIETLRSLRAKKDDFAREKTGMEKLTMQPGLPNVLMYQCEPWEGLPARYLRVRIQAADNGNAALKLTLTAWEAQRQNLLEEFRSGLVDRLDTCPIPIYSGSFTRPLGR